MKRIFLVSLSCLFLGLMGCGSESVSDSAAESASQVEDNETTQDADEITAEQALEIIKEYCVANNPDLEEMMDTEDYTVYFETYTSDDGEIVVLYRSYTGAETRYYIDPSTGDTYVTELVPGIIDEEQETGETFNINEL